MVTSPFAILFIPEWYTIVVAGYLDFEGSETCPVPQAPLAESLSLTLYLPPEEGKGHHRVRARRKLNFCWAVISSLVMRTS